MHGVPAVPTTPTTQSTPATQIPPFDPTAPTAPVAQPQKDSAKTDETAFEAALAAAEKSPEMTYEDRVKEQGLTMADAMGIIDAMLTRGIYEKSFPVTSKFSVTFRTRSVEDSDKMFEKLEKIKPEFNLSIAGHMAKYNLIHSLAAFGNKQFENTPAGKEMASKFVAALPGPMFALLVNKLAKFDNQINTVLEDGAIENF